MVALVEVDLEKIEQYLKAQRINITIPKYLLKNVDKAAKSIGYNRSKFFQTAAEKLIKEKAV